MISIKDVKFVNKGFRKATFSIVISEYDLIIKSVSLFEKNGAQWIAFPSKEYELEGEKKYFSYIWFESIEANTKFQSQVKELFKKAEQSQEVPF